MTFTIQYIREHKGILLMQAFFACVFAAECLGEEPSLVHMKSIRDW